jgi:hypothetical protein
MHCDSFTKNSVAMLIAVKEAVFSFLPLVFIDLASVSHVISSFTFGLDVTHAALHFLKLINFEVRMNHLFNWCSC